MNEDFVPFELAVKLKEKGLDCAPFAMYNEEGVLYELYTAVDDGHYYEPDDFDERDVIAPTISQVLKWLRVQSVDIVIRPIFVDGCREYTTEIYAPRYNKPYHIGNVSDWGKAAITGIKYALDNLI